MGVTHERESPGNIPPRAENDPKVDLVPGSLAQLESSNADQDSALSFQWFANGRRYVARLPGLVARGLPSNAVMCGRMRRRLSSRVNGLGTKLLKYNNFHIPFWSLYEFWRSERTGPQRRLQRWFG